MADYEYQVDDFPNNSVAVDRLTLEIQQSAIAVALDGITVSTIVTIGFKAPLSGAEATVLDGIVAAHSGVTLPDPVNPQGVPYTALYGKENQVQIVGRQGAEMIRVTHNYCDPSTWFGDSVRISNEVLVDSGDGLTWHSQYPFWIDMQHGRVHDEERVRAEQMEANPGSPHGYMPVVTVGGVRQTMRPIRATDWSLGGDYYVDFVAGRVVFQSPPASAPQVSYSHATESGYYLTPKAGRAIEIGDAELQWINVNFSACIVQETQVMVAPGTWVGPEVFAPGEVYKYRSLFKGFTQITDEARGSFPSQKAVVGTPPWRGTGGEDVHHTPLIYSAVRRLASSDNVRMKLWIGYVSYDEDNSLIVTPLDASNGVDTGLGGDRATATFYAVSVEE